MKHASHQAFDTQLVGSIYDIYEGLDERVSELMAKPVAEAPIADNTKRARMRIDTIRDAMKPLTVFNMEIAK